MNLLLLDPEETASEEVTLHGRRAEHMVRVLRVSVGDTLRCGVMDGAQGSATVVAVGSGRDPSVTLTTHLTEPSTPAEHGLLLAVPRPKVLQRIVAHAASLGFGEVVLVRTWTCDRSHVEAVQRRIEADAAAGHRPYETELRIGLEQGRRTVLPRLRCEPLFKPFAEDHLGTMWREHTRWLAHPGAATAAWAQSHCSSPLALALGPERGFTGYEVERLAEAGMLPIHAGPHPLRTETALGVFAGLAMACRRGV